MRVILRNNGYHESIIGRGIFNRFLGSNLFQNLAPTIVLYISNWPDT